MNDTNKGLRKNIQMERIRTKSNLNRLRFLQEQTGRNYEKEINEGLDYLNQLNELEKRLKG
ncbi:MAG: hypothetical protein LUH15_17660 [Tannerellaceae bacterium]|nr:hypothetical protein [Tannerellaceae bacterium]